MDKLARHIISLGVSRILGLRTFLVADTIYTSSYSEPETKDVVSIFKENVIKFVRLGAYPKGITTGHVSSELLWNTKLTRL
jgi:hypothetical protein